MTDTTATIDLYMKGVKESPQKTSLSSAKETPPQVAHPASRSTQGAKYYEWSDADDLNISRYKSTRYEPDLGGIATNTTVVVFGMLLLAGLLSLGF